MFNCVGEREDVELLAKEKSGAKAEKGEDQTFMMAAARLGVCVVGIQVSYLLWGLMQERIMTRPYETGELFRSSKFLVFANRIIALLVSALVLP